MLYSKRANIELGHPQEKEFLRNTGFHHLCVGLFIEPVMWGNSLTCAALTESARLPNLQQGVESEFRPGSPGGQGGLHKLLKIWKIHLIFS